MTETTFQTLEPLLLMLQPGNHLNARHADTVQDCTNMFSALTHVEGRQI